MTKTSVPRSSTPALLASKCEKFGQTKPNSRVNLEAKRRFSSENRFLTMLTSRSNILQVSRGAVKVDTKIQVLCSGFDHHAQVKQLGQESRKNSLTQLVKKLVLQKPPKQLQSRKTS